jgi:S1-C subfamily serine protease
MHQLTRGALLATAFTATLATAAVAQEGTRVTGTITLRQQPDGLLHVVTPRRARLGLSVDLRATPTDSIGAVIQTVTPGGPAARAGIQSGDIVLRFNGKLVAEPGTDLRDREEPSAPGIRLIELASTLAPGDSAVVQYRRGRTLRSATLVAGNDPVGVTNGNSMIYTWQSPSLAPAPLGTTYDYGFGDNMTVSGDSVVRVPMYSRRTPMPRMFVLGSVLADLELAPINPELGRYFGTTEGVLVIDVPQDSKLGLKPGDVVLTIDGREVRVPTQLLRAMQSYEPGESFTLQVMRQKSRVTVTGSVAQ